MSGTTDDRSDPRLTHGVDETSRPQAEVYLVLSDEERAKGFVRPVRRSYVFYPAFVLAVGPKQLRDLVRLTDQAVEAACEAAS